MNNHEPLCQHRWRYYVNVASRAVRARVCERWGVRAVVSARTTAAEPPVLPLSA